MMIAGFVVTAALAGHFLDPYLAGAARGGDGLGLRHRRRC